MMVLAARSPAATTAESANVNVERQLIGGGGSGSGGGAFGGLGNLFGGNKGNGNGGCKSPFRLHL